MSYDMPIKERYVLPSATYGSVAATQIIRGPKGMKGIVRDITVIPTVNLVGSTTVPELNVGSSAVLSEYARFRLGTTATAGYTVAQGTRRARALATSSTTPPTLTDYSGHISLETASIPADTDVYITAVIGVGAPAGTYSAYVDIEWF